MDQNQKQQAVEQLKNAGTVLVTTVTNPTTDQLTAALGLSLMLKKMGKNVSTVITSPVSDSLKFLKAEKQLEDNLDSLRDFILSLDKNLADKLRYKVEGDEVRIFITPYHTKIAKEDIRFSQGDFNVDAVVVIGAVNRADIDQAVMSQSRVLNETPVITVTCGASQSSVGGTSWHDPQASSVSEMMVSVSEALQPGLLDEQSSNALLTGIIAATDHFSNPDTSPKVMTMAAQLMASGADQQMIMRELKSQISPDTKPNKAIAESSDDGKPVDLKDDEASDIDNDDDKVSNKTSKNDHDMKISHNDELEDSLIAEPVPADVKLDNSESKDTATTPPLPPQLVEEPPQSAPEPVRAEPVAATDSAAANGTFQIPTPPSVPQPAPRTDNLASVADQQTNPAVVANNPDAAADEEARARAAVEAAMANQPSGTAMNPTQSIGAHEFTDTRVPTPPQLDQTPTQTPQVPADQAGSTGVVGSVNPSQLYPNVNGPYDQN